MWFPVVQGSNKACEHLCPNILEQTSQLGLQPKRLAVIRVASSVADAREMTKVYEDVYISELRGRPFLCPHAFDSEAPVVDGSSCGVKRG